MSFMSKGSLFSFIFHSLIHLAVLSWASFVKPLEKPLNMTCLQSSKNLFLSLHVNQTMITEETHPVIMPSGLKPPETPCSGSLLWIYSPTYWAYWAVMLTCWKCCPNYFSHFAWLSDRRIYFLFLQCSVGRMVLRWKHIWDHKMKWSAFADSSPQHITRRLYNGPPVESDNQNMSQCCIWACGVCGFCESCQRK